MKSTRIVPYLLGAVAMLVPVASARNAVADAIPVTPPPSMGIDPATLPICPPPGPQKVSAIPPKPLQLDDPTIAKCAYAPGITGQTHIPGFADDAPIVVTDAWFDGVGRRSADTVIHVNIGPGSGNVGLVDSNGQGDRRGIFSSLYAHAPVLAGTADVYNWIGIQNDANLTQVGIDYNNVPAAQECPNNVNNRPFILSQSERDGVFSNNICIPGYIFGVGSFTSFETAYAGNRNWQHWINWNNTWQLLLTVNVPHLETIAGRGAQSVETIVHNNQPAPAFNIPNNSTQLADTAGWHWWFNSYSPPTVVNNWVGAYCQSFPVLFTNLTVKNC